MLSQKQSGFTITELIIAIVVLGILFAIALPNYIKYKDKAREKEVKANIHQIQIALERYGVDHDHYPAMIWGGDKKGWSTEKGVGCRTMWEHEEYDPEKDNNATARPPFDPLIFYNYLEIYPRNPFMTQKDSLETTINWTGPQNAQFGDGDPRFGFYGELMGNIIEDPRYLWYKDKNGKIRESRISNCFLDETQKYKAIIHNRLLFNPFYSMGGIPEKCPAPSDTDNDGLYDYMWKSYWPGEFFYRSCGEIDFSFEPMDESRKTPSYNKIWDFEYKSIRNYILGGFGSMRADGLDVLRLTNLAPSAFDNQIGYSKNEYYEPNPKYPWTSENRVYFSSPEVFGGGSKKQMPYFPYTDPENNTWLYGAPDGYPDGVITCVTADYRLGKPNPDGWM